MAYGISSFGVGAFGVDSELHVSFNEAAALLDSLSQYAAFGLSASEAGLLVDQLQGNLVIPVSASDSQTLQDEASPVTTYFLQISENGSLVDLLGVGAVLSSTLDDAAAFEDWIASGQLFSKIQDEVAALSDSGDASIVVALTMVLGNARISDGPISSGAKKLMNYYILGSSVTLISDFSDVNGLPVEPNEVSIEIMQPDDTSVVVGSSQITNLGGGTYTFVFQPTMTGIHFYRFTGQGANSVEAYFLVQQAFN